MDILELLKEKLIYAELPVLPSDLILNFELDMASKFINYRRNHTPTETAPMPPEFSGIQVELAMYKLLKTGADGQSGHSENGVSRTYLTDWGYPRDLVRQIMWVAR